MTRDSVDELLIDYLYDELDDASRSAFEAALPSYPELAAEVAAHRETRSLAARLPEWKLSSAALARIEGAALAAFESASDDGAKAVPEATQERATGSLFERLAQLFMRPAFAGGLAMALIATVGVVVWQQRAHEGTTNSQRVAPRISAAPQVVSPSAVEQPVLEARDELAAPVTPTEEKKAAPASVGGIDTATKRERTQAEGAKVALPTLAPKAAERGGAAPPVAATPPVVTPPRPPAASAKRDMSRRTKSTAARKKRQAGRKLNSARGDGPGASTDAITDQLNAAGASPAAGSATTGSGGVRTYGGSAKSATASSSGSLLADLSEPAPEERSVDALWDSYDRHVRAGRYLAAQKVLKQIEALGKTSRTVAAREELERLDAQGAGGPPRRVPAAKRRSRATKSTTGN